MGVSVFLYMKFIVQLILISIIITITIVNQKRGKFQIILFSSNFNAVVLQIIILMGYL